MQQPDGQVKTFCNQVYLTPLSSWVCVEPRHMNADFNLSRCTTYHLIPRNWARTDDLIDFCHFCDLLTQGGESEGLGECYIISEEEGFWGTVIWWIMELSFPRTFAPGSESSILGIFARWNFRSMELSSRGTFAPESENDVELSLPNTNYQWFIQTLRRPSTKFPTIDW